MAFRLEPARRFWAVYEGDTLVCLTVYKKGARSVIDRLTRLAESNDIERKDTDYEPAHHAAMP
ncbi:MAG: hypothetical protein ACRD3J_28755 [Thermoanaerobaculia bacterium]